MGNSIFEEVSKIFKDSVIPPHINETLITLILKCLGANYLTLFRLISLCNIVYKVVTKLICPLQRTFVPRRIGLDNMIITQEIINSMSLKKGKVGYMVIKIDLEKTYDILEWHFIWNVLNLYQFLTCLINLIINCVTRSSILVLFNRGKLDPFLTLRGIRQGDLLSPYLFIMCMEILGFLISRKCEEKLWDPVKAS